MATRITHYGIFAFLSACLAILPVQADEPSTLTLPALDSGWYTDGGYHDPSNDNFAAGKIFDGSYTQYRDWFAFDIPAALPPVISAELRIYTFDISTFDDSETYQLREIVTSPDVLRAGGEGRTNIYTDLGDGPIYGSAAFSTEDSYAHITIPLNSTCLSSILAARGSVFSLGGELVSLTQDPSYELLFGNSEGSANVELLLTVDYNAGPPVLSSNMPRAKTVFTNTDVNFSVTAFGQQTLVYQWRHNGQDLPGETNNELQLSKVKLNQSGVYSVVITNPVGRVTNETILTVLEHASVPSGIVGWWRGDGNTKDSIGGHHGTNGAGGLAFVDGMVRQAFSFAGNIDQGIVARSDTPLVSSNAVSVEAWIYPTGREGGERLIVSDVPYGLSISTDDRIHANLRMWVGGINEWGDYEEYEQSETIAAESPVELNRWYHVAMTYDRTNINLYVDGELAATVARSWPISHSVTALRIGGYSYYYYYDYEWYDFYDYTFQGAIDEVSVYNRALTPEEISILHAAGPNGKVNMFHIYWQNWAGQLAYWKMVGTTRTESGLLRGGLRVPSDWQIVSVTDLDEDGHADFLWQNRDNRLAAWHMRQTSFLGSVLLRDGRPATPGWRVTGVYDFDRDSEKDILWRHDDGRMAVWYMKQTDYFTSALLNGGGDVNPLWRISGVTDYDDDGNADLIWKHDDGWLMATYLNGLNFRNTVYLNNRQRVDKAWRLACVMDLNGDEQPDYLWNHADGRAVIWYMNGDSREEVLNLPRAAAGWKIIGAE